MRILINSLISNLLNVDKSAYLNILDGGTILDPTGTANSYCKTF